MKMNIFLMHMQFVFKKQQKKAIFLNYDVINDVVMTQCIYQ